MAGDSAANMLDERDLESLGVSTASAPERLDFDAGACRSSANEVVHMDLPNVKFGGNFLPFEDEIKRRFPARRTYSVDDVILSVNGNRNRECFYILSGEVVFTFMDDEGRSGISSFRGPGAVFPLWLSNNATATPLQTVASKETRVVVLPKKELRAFMVERPEFAIAMLDAYGEYCTYLLYSLESQTFESTRTRLCSFLYLHCDEDGVLPMTHDVIAHATGMTRENASRLLSDLQKHGLVESRRGRIKVLNKKRLLGFSSSIVTSAMQD